MDIAETSANNFVLIGTNVDSSGSQLEKKLTLVGTDNIGNLQWKKSYGGNKFTYSPYTYVPGLFIKHKNYLFSATMAKDSNGYAPGVFIKFDFNGDTVWQKKYYQPITTQVIFTSVCPSVDNGFYITGALYETSPGYNNHPVTCMYLLKTDADGNKLWDKKIYKTNLDKTKIGNGIVQDSVTKRLIIVGIEDYDTGGNGSSIMIFDSLGNKITQKEGFIDCGLVRLIKLKDGCFLSGGDAWAPGQINGNSLTQSLLVKFDTSGTRIYTQQYDTSAIINAIFAIKELANGEVIAGGGQEITTKYTGGINEVCKIMKVDKYGNLLWKKYFDNITDIFNQDRLSGMCITSNNQIAFTSYATSNQSPLTFMFYRTDTSYCDVNAIGCYSYTTMGLNKLQIADYRLKVWPNPVDEMLRIQIQGPGYRTQDTRLMTQDFTIDIINTMGQTIVSKAMRPEDERYELSCTELPAGFYMIRFTQQGKPFATRKLLVEH